MMTVQTWEFYKQEVLRELGKFSSIYQEIQNQKPSGDGWISGICPFHEDKRASFSFHTSTGNWTCHAGCGGGSSFDFVMMQTGAGFKEVLLSLGDDLGLDRPEGESI